MSGEASGDNRICNGNSIGSSAIMLLFAGGGPYIYPKVVLHANGDERICFDDNLDRAEGRVWL